MNVRFKEIRKSKGLTQAEFGSVLGVSRDVIANIENGRNDLSDLMIRSLMGSFTDVNETWLRTGEGEMYAPITREQEIANIVSAIYQNKDEFRTKLIEMLVMMNEEQMEFLKDFAVKLAEAAKNE